MIRNQPSTFACYEDHGQDWYELFSRGARDWLRHNEKIGKAVREKLPELIANADVLGSGESTVKVPVRFMEHFRFRLRPPEALFILIESGAKVLLFEERYAPVFEPIREYLLPVDHYLCSSGTSSSVFLVS